MGEAVNNCNCDMCVMLRECEEHKKIMEAAGLESSVFLLNKLLTVMFEFRTELMHAQRLINGTWPGADKIIEEMRKDINGKDMVH